MEHLMVAVASLRLGKPHAARAASRQERTTACGLPGSVLARRRRAQMPPDPAHRSHYADQRAAARALALALPSIEAAVRDRTIAGTGFLHIVVMDPGLDPATMAFDDAILVEHSIGNVRDWDADYAGFARAKAALAWRSGAGSGHLQTLAPHRLRRGESLLEGAVVLDGLVVAVSGAQPWFDEAFAFTIAVMLRAVAQQRRADERAAGALVAGGMAR
jgi:hypothetical protein